MYYLGIDVGGTTIKAGLVDETGVLGVARKIPTIVADLQGFVATISDLVADFQRTNPIAAVGIGIPGLLGLESRIVETSPNIPCIHQVCLEQIIADRVKLPVITENDANAGAYAEAVCGAARGLQHAVYLTLGTGLGSGLVLNGKLFRGASGYAGEMGHTTVEPSGRTCACGNTGCLETYVSGTGMVRTAQELMNSAHAPISAEDIYEAAVRGDSAAFEIFRITGLYLGIACANLINLFNLECIVIGGGVMASGDLLLKPAIAEAQRRAFPAAFQSCRIVQSNLWPDAGLVGAAMLARDL
jgi:glucokinase